VQLSYVLEKKKLPARQQMHFVSFLQQNLPLIPLPHENSERAPMLEQDLLSYCVVHQVTLSQAFQPI
jgi:hypothetical protein